MGSEMCIRDSLGRPPRSSKTANMGIGDKVCRGQQRREAVSFVGLDEAKEFGLFYSDIFG